MHWYFTYASDFSVLSIDTICICDRVVFMELGNSSGTEELNQSYAVQTGK